MKQRENNRLIEERKDSKGRLLCLIPTCNKLRQKYKTSNRTRNYCSKHSFWDIREFTNWQSLRKKVLKRNNYSCVKCGDNRREIQIEKVNPWDGSKIMEKVNNFIGDHIIPIALGGDEWDLNNIQTLCLKCNKIKTTQDIKNIAKQRRIEKKQNENTTFK